MGFEKVPTVEEIKGQLKSFWSEPDLTINYEPTTYEGGLSSFLVMFPASYREDMYNPRKSALINHVGEKRYIERGVYVFSPNRRITITFNDLSTLAWNLT